MVKTFHTTEQLLQVLQASLAQHEDIVWELEEQDGGFVIRSKDKTFDLEQWWESFSTEYDEMLQLLANS